MKKPYSNNMTIELQTRINNFLSTHRESDGGWAKITDKDMKDLGDIIQTLIELKCDRDPDGDLPVQYALCNRRTHHFAIHPWINTIPYRDDEEDETGRITVDPLEKGGRLEKLMSIARQASELAARELDVAQYMHSLYNKPKT